jgi:hypothetical protein
MQEMGHMWQNSFSVSNIQSPMVLPLIKNNKRGTYLWQQTNIMRVLYFVLMKE